MSISKTADRWEYAGDGVTTLFAYENKAPAAADLLVHLDGLLQTSGYTVTNVGQEDGGNVSFAAAPGVGVVVLILLRVAPLQPDEYEDGDDFPAAVVEGGFDRVTLMVQRALAAIARSTRWPETETGAPSAVLPALATRASKTAGWDASGAWVALAGVTPDEVIVSSFMEGILAAADGDTALVGLGFSAFALTLIAAADADAYRTLLEVIAQDDVQVALAHQFYT